MSEGERETVGNRVREMRLARGLSAAQLAAEVGIHRSRLQRLEQDHARVTLSLLESLADALKVSLAALLVGRDTGPVSPPLPRRFLLETSADPLGRSVYLVEVLCGDLRHYEVLTVGRDGYVYSWTTNKDRSSAMRELGLLAEGR